MLGLTLIAVCALSAGRQHAPVDLRADTWVAVDGLGREVWHKPSPPRRRTVGMFYFLANHVLNQPVYDITKILHANPSHPEYGPYLTPHWWGEPWLGYYESDDKAVLRKHMTMLANAGVDVLVFDNTNGPTYPDVYLPLCEVLEEMKSKGLRAPQVAFFTGHGAWNTLESDFYGKGLFRDLWFQWKGKPLMLVHLESGDVLPQAIADRFSVRESWAWTPSSWFGNGHDKWPWLDNYPQNFGWDKDPNTPEEVAVEVGQHATSSIGRSSVSQHEPAVNDERITPETAKGLCFSQQFERALQIDPEFIFVTGWNEWTATRFRQESNGIMAGKPEPKGGSFFVDEYNAEFSRDIEPAKGLLQDNYYYQLVSFVRRYKGGRKEPEVSHQSIDARGSFSQWSKVTPEYRDGVGDPVHRDHAGWGQLHYSNDSGRNDIVAAKVAYDSKNLSFYVRCENALSSPIDPNWMLLFLNVGGNYRKGWLGYDFRVNARRTGATCSLEANVGRAYSWKPVGAVSCRFHGKEMMIVIPRKMLGLPRGHQVVDFKWADGILGTGEASDFTLNGDSAPDDRFNYRAELGS